MKTYLASRYGRRLEMLAHAEELKALGVEVTSRWVTGVHEKPGKGDGHGPVPYTTEEQAHFAREDAEDIARSDALILFTEEPGASGGARGGRFVEMGIALALNKTVVVIGPRENCFCCLASIDHYDDWESFIADGRKARMITDLLARACGGDRSLN